MVGLLLATSQARPARMSAARAPESVSTRMWSGGKPLRTSASRMSAASAAPPKLGRVPPWNWSMPMSRAHRLAGGVSRLGPSREHEQDGQDEGPRQAEDSGRSPHALVLTTSSERRNTSESHLGWSVCRYTGGSDAAIGAAPGSSFLLWPPPAAPAMPGRPTVPRSSNRSTTHLTMTTHRRAHLRPTFGPGVAPSRHRPPDGRHRHPPPHPGPHHRRRPRRPRRVRQGQDRARARPSPSASPCS